MKKQFPYQYKIYGTYYIIIFIFPNSTARHKSLVVYAINCKIYWYVGIAFNFGISFTLQALQ